MLPCIFIAMCVCVGMNDHVDKIDIFWCLCVGVRHEFENIRETLRFLCVASSQRIVEWSTNRVEWLLCMFVASIRDTEWMHSSVYEMYVSSRWEMMMRHFSHLKDAGGCHPINSSTDPHLWECEHYLFVGVSLKTTTVSDDCYGSSLSGSFQLIVAASGASQLM